jgi:hypothetical protein
LNPRNPDPISHVAVGHGRAECDDLSGRFVADGPGKLGGEIPPGDVDIGITDAAGVNLDQDLTGTRLRVRYFSNLPRAVRRGNDCCLHDNAPLRA